MDPVTLALAKAASAPPAGLFRSGYYYGTPGFSSLNTQALTDGTGYFCPLSVDAPTTFDRIGIEVTTAGAPSSVIRLGIYANGADGTPGALVLDAGTVEADSTGGREATIDVTLPRGVYWLAAVPQGGAPTVRGHRGSAIPVGHASLLFAIGVVLGGWLGNAAIPAALPATTTVGNGQVTAPRVVLRAA